MKKEKLTKLVEEVDVPEGVTVSCADGLISVKGEKGEVSKRLVHPGIKIEAKPGKIILSSDKATKKEKRIILTFKSHIYNLIKGSQTGFTYKLKICSGHFPMSASLKGDVFELKNFLGESVPRRLKIKPGADVKVEDAIITIDCVSKELAGQIASDFEQLTRITDKDRRIFQDGIFLIQKGDKELV